eukprot:TRINITY_DN8843_c3_g1_i1.p1 TRINITY_DN8843_c3_g1~~TRINITY_DN8843_c3_g1_i1.p1  ORF type:complete len:462 (+),score=143.12 TRINITY_DN8843_c3_g1_i1:80-1387(+)
MRRQALGLVVGAAVCVLLLAARASPGTAQQQQQQHSALARRIAKLEEDAQERDRKLSRVSRSAEEAERTAAQLREQLQAAESHLEQLESRSARGPAAVSRPPTGGGTPAQLRSTQSGTRSNTGGAGEQRAPPKGGSRPGTDGGSSGRSAANLADSAQGIGVGVPNRESTEGAPSTLAPELAGIQCPNLTAQTGGDIPLEHLPRGKPTTVAQKYDRRASNCFKHGLWSSVSLEDHRKIMDVIARIANIGKGSLLFDWGCGCGHKLNWFSRTQQTSGLGVDVSAKTLEYASTEMSKANRFCWADGSNLWWVPSNTFDAAFSFGSVFHLYNESLMCRSYKEMLRIVKPGGKVYNGWTAEDEFTNSALFKCLRNAPAVGKIEIFRELGTKDALFQGIKTFPTKLKGYGLGNEINRVRMPDRRWRKLKPPSYSHLIHKAG